jgi:hypothetical protein
VTAAQILEALRRRHPPERYPYKWAFFSELRCGTGYTGRADVEQRLDAFAVNLWPSERYERIAYEVKVSRSDFQAEVKHPLKRRRALLLSNLFYFATPKGLLKPKEIPPEAGLIEVDEAGECHITVPSPWRDTPPPTWAFLASVARQAMHYQGLAEVRAKETAGSVKA